MSPEIFNYLRTGLIFYFILLGSICIHEWAHAFAADKRGDPLPAHQGRVTLNPLAHIDLLGTVFFPLLIIFGPLIFGGSMGIALLGWGKPVEISLPNPKTRIKDDIIITAAGPLSNLAIALVATGVGFVLARMVPNSLEIIAKAITLNIALFVFNLIPVPPLDGSTFIRYLIGMGEETYYRLSQYGFIVLLILINWEAFRHTLGYVITQISWPLIRFIIPEMP